MSVTRGASEPGDTQKDQRSSSGATQPGDTHRDMNPASTSAVGVSQSHGRLGVGIIGMGTAGPVIGSALRQAGHAIVGVSAQGAEAIERADILLPGVPVMDVPELVERCELVVLAVPDDQISGLVTGLSELGAWKMGQIVLHLAGPYGTQILDPARAQGAITLAIHPVLRLSGLSVDVQRLIGAPFLVTAPAPFLPIAQALVVEMGGEPILVEEEARSTVDAALTLGVTGIVSSVLAFLSIVDEVGIDMAHFPLSRFFAEAASGALEDEERAFGAPFTTADAQVVQAHTCALRNADRLARGLYASRAREAIVYLASRGRISERDADALTTALLEE